MKSSLERGDPHTGLPCNFPGWKVSNMQPDLGMGADIRSDMIKGAFS